MKATGTTTETAAETTAAETTATETRTKMKATEMKATEAATARAAGTRTHAAETGAAAAGAAGARATETGPAGTAPGEPRARLRIAVLGASGMVGSRVTREAAARGHQVLALSREPASDDPAVAPVAVDAHDPEALRAALTASGAEAVVLAVRTEPADRDFLVGTTRTVLDAAARTGARVLVVGGAGALRSPGRPDLLVADDPAYVPDDLRPVAAAGVAQLRAAQEHAHGDWVYLSPPALLEPGLRTGRYRRGGDTLLTAADGRSWISAEDLAAAVVDELESPGSERHLTVVHRDGPPAA